MHVHQKIQEEHKPLEINLFINNFENGQKSSGVQI